MRNMKKFLALVLAMLMITSMAVMTTSAADEADYTEAAETLNALKIMKGNEKGDLMLDQGVTRYQTALFFVQALTGKTDVATWNAVKTSVNFADVIDYGTAIDYAYGVGVVKGRGNGAYGYNDPIIYQDMLVMAVRALGYETSDMSYPYGHILMAQKVGLTEDVDLVNYQQALNRGETAQIIANMLDIEVAYTDPMTGEVLMPGVYEGMAERIVNAQIDRTLEPTDPGYKPLTLIDRETLLEKAEFAADELTGVIVNFEPADEDDEESVAEVTIENVDVVGTDTIESGRFVLPAAEFGITEETATATYMGLPINFFIDCEFADFTEAAYEDGEANIVMVKKPEYTTVENFGDGAIKVINTSSTDINDPDSYVVLGNDKFTNAKYWTKLMTWNGTEWEDASTDDFFNLFASYLYDAKKDEYVGAADATAQARNPYDSYTTKALANYGKVQYRVTEDYVGTKQVVEALYTPYAFGQYVTRDMTYAVTSETTTFTLIGTLGASTMDGEATIVTERLLGQTSALTTTKNSIRKNAGELSATVAVSGEAVQSGDFMFYDYNKADNTLYVAKNCGTLATGRMTTTNPTKETVKISGESYGFGLAGLYTVTGGTAYSKTTMEGFVTTLEAGKDNVQYLAVDGNIVYVTAYTGDSETTVGDFAVISTDAKIVAKLLGISENKYTDALVGAWPKTAANPTHPGVYVKDGYAVVAMLNLTTGEWELANIGGVALAYTDDTTTAVVDYEFTSVVDVATMAGYAEIATLADATSYQNATLLLKNGLVTVAEVEDGVYTIADINTTYVDGTTTKNLVARVAETAGLVFSASGVSNAITADPDATASDKARVTTNEDTVLVLVNEDGTIGVRTGVQTNKAAIQINGTVNYFAAGADLIVMTANKSVKDAEVWGQAAGISTTANYFLTTAETNYEYATTENDDEYSITVVGLYDLKNFAADAEVTITGTKSEVDAVVTTLNAAKATGNGRVLYLGDDSTLTFNPNTKLGDALVALLADTGDFEKATIKNFTDANTIAFNTNLNTAPAGVDLSTITTAVSAINVKVATADLTDIDWSEIDLDTMYVSSIVNPTTVYEGIAIDNFVDTNNDGKVDTTDDEYYAYAIDLGTDVADLTAPQADVLDEFVVAMSGKTITVADEDGFTYSFVVGVNAVAEYDDNTDTVNVYVVKYVK